MTKDSEIKKFNEKRYQELQKERVGVADDVRIRQAVQLIGESSKVLDVGCFDGMISKMIMEQGNEVYGLDVSAPAVKKAQEKGIKAVCGNVEDPWPFANDQFDVVFAGEIIEHLFDTDKFLEEVKRVLKPGGSLVLTTPNLASFGRRLLLFLGKNPLIETGCLDVFAGHLRYFVKESLFELLSRNGFKIIRFESTVVNFNALGTIYSRKPAQIFPTLGSSLIVKCQVQKMTRKKALFIANGIVGEDPGLTGGEVRFIEIAKGWAKKGYEIHLLSSKGGRKLCQKLGLDVVLRTTTESGRTDRLAFISLFLKSFRIPESLKNFDGEIVYATNEQLYDVLPGVLLKIKRRSRIKFAVVVHWLPPVLWWRRKESTFFNSLLFLLSERASLLLAGIFADSLLAVSESTKTQIRQSFIGNFFINKTTAVACGVNFKKIRSLVESGAKEKIYDAVFMKRIQAVKGIFDLIEIWEKVLTKRPDARLAIIGSGIDEEEAKRRVKERGLERAIEFLGVIYDDREKFAKITQSKLFLLPSYEENWAIVIGEAMAAGVPVVAYGLKELVDVWGDNFVRVPVGDKETFAQKVVELLTNREQGEKLATKALDFIKKYDWKAISEKELEIVTQ